MRGSGSQGRTPAGIVGPTGNKKETGAAAVCARCAVRGVCVSGVGWCVGGWVVELVGRGGLRGAPCVTRGGSCASVFHGVSDISFRMVCRSLPRTCTQAAGVARRLQGV